MELSEEVVFYEACDDGIRPFDLPTFGCILPASRGGCRFNRPRSPNISIEIYVHSSSSSFTYSHIGYLSSKSKNSVFSTGTARVCMMNDDDSIFRPSLDLVSPLLVCKLRRCQISLRM